MACRKYFKIWSAENVSCKFHFWCNLICHFVTYFQCFSNSALKKNNNKLCTLQHFQKRVFLAESLECRTSQSPQDSFINMTLICSTMNDIFFFFFKSAHSPSSIESSPDTRFCSSAFSNSILYTYTQNERTHTYRLGHARAGRQRGARRSVSGGAYIWRGLSGGATVTAHLPSSQHVSHSLT